MRSRNISARTYVHKNVRIFIQQSPERSCVIETNFIFGIFSVPHTKRLIISHAAVKIMKVIKQKPHRTTTVVMYARDKETNKKKRRIGILYKKEKHVFPLICAATIAGERAIYKHVFKGVMCASFTIYKRSLLITAQ